MKIAIPSENSTIESQLDLRFGRAKCFIIYDDHNDSCQVINNEQNLNSAQGAGIQSAAAVVNEGCGALICGHCGPKAFKALTKAGVTIYSSGKSTVKDAITLFLDGKLPKMEGADVDGHW